MESEQWAFYLSGTFVGSVCGLQGWGIGSAHSFIFISNTSPAQAGPKERLKCVRSCLAPALVASRFRSPAPKFPALCFCTMTKARVNSNVWRKGWAPVSAKEQGARTFFQTWRKEKKGRCDVCDFGDWTNGVMCSCSEGQHRSQSHLEMEPTKAEHIC